MCLNKKRLTRVTNDKVELKLISFRIKFSRCGVASLFLFVDVLFGAVFARSLLILMRSL